MNLMYNPRDNQRGEHIKKIEKEADKVRRKLIDYIQTSFITPLDRHDLFALSRKIDDVTDKAKDLKDFIFHFDFVPSETDIEMIELISKSIARIDSAMNSWAKGNDNKFWDQLVIVKKDENKIKRMYWTNINEIEKNDYSINRIIIITEFNKDLNKLANKAGKVADILGEVKIKSLK